MPSLTKCSKLEEPARLSHRREPIKDHPLQGAVPFVVGGSL
jgi:hypothetical protein